ncbi:putative RING-H2 finger protein ATL21A [Hibiscus syriacus]|uniref:putative RING-H2 finger protein ATL21A n=1 Tax=Hibiscus syriacus TaxID=106335 RepID=UPI0019207306|nr:putative RING-H2 finger protein ATL21A [Hibiscus syriacus]
MTSSDHSKSNDPTSSRGKEKVWEREDYRGEDLLHKSKQVEPLSNKEAAFVDGISETDHQRSHAALIIVVVPGNIPCTRNNSPAAVFLRPVVLHFPSRIPSSCSFLLLLLCAAAAAEPCSIARCGKNKVPIRFPFRQQGKQPENCGYRGFDLRCGSQDTIYLDLPYSGEFYVRDINHLDQQISLYDPGDCLPKRLLGLNLPGSPFVPVFIQNYTFLNCPTQVTTSRFNAIDCLTNSTNSVLATSSARLANRIASSSCRIITVLSIPVPWQAKDDEEFTAALDADIQLTWNAPRCGDCKEQGVICGLKSNSSEEIFCFHTPSKDIS